MDAILSLVSDFDVEEEMQTIDFTAVDIEESQMAIQKATQEEIKYSNLGMILFGSFIGTNIIIGAALCVILL